MKIKQNCYICGKYLFGLNFDCKSIIFCPACFKKLEGDEKSFVETIHRKCEEIKSLKNMIDNRLHWSDLKIDNH